MSENNISKEDMLKALNTLVKGSTEYLKDYLEATEEAPSEKKSKSNLFDDSKMTALDKQFSKDYFDAPKAETWSYGQPKAKDKTMEAADIVLDLYNGIKKTNPQYVDNDDVKEMLSDVSSHFNNMVSTEGASIIGTVNRLSNNTASIKFKVSGNATDFKNLMMYALYLYGMHPNDVIGSESGNSLDSNDENVLIFSELISLIVFATVKG